jgi:hypothetical protein
MLIPSIIKGSFTLWCDFCQNFIFTPPGQDYTVEQFREQAKEMRWEFNEKKWKCRKCLERKSL